MGQGARYPTPGTEPRTGHPVCSENANHNRMKHTAIPLIRSIIRHRELVVSFAKYRSTGNSLRASDNLISIKDRNDPRSFYYSPYITFHYINSIFLLFFVLYHWIFSVVASIAASKYVNFLILMQPFNFWNFSSQQWDAERVILEKFGIFEFWRANLSFRQWHFEAVLKVLSLELHHESNTLRYLLVFVRLFLLWNIKYAKGWDVLPK